MDFQQCMLFFQKFPTSKWQVQDVETLLAEAFVLQSLYVSQLEKMFFGIYIFLCFQPMGLQKVVFVFFIPSVEIQRISIFQKLFLGVGAFFQFHRLKFE